MKQTGRPLGSLLDEYYSEAKEDNFLA